MKNIRLYLVFVVMIIVLIIIGKCNNRNNPYKPVVKAPKKESAIKEELKKYAGGYTIEVVNNYSKNEYVEAYALREDGSATWRYIKNLGNGNAKTVSKKDGSWGIIENQMTITINGNTGVLTETYVMNVAGYWTMVGSGRYLKPIP